VGLVLEGRVGAEGAVLKVRWMSTVLVLSVLGVLGAAGAAVAAQEPVAGQQRTITGQVVDAGSGRPVSAALVTLVLAKIEGLPVLTGADGRFAFRVSAQDASYTLTARKGGYADGGSGRMRIGGALQPVRLSALAPSANVTIRMWKLGAIAGTVIDEAGEPVVNVQVRALKKTTSGGRSSIAPTGAVATTDDRGVYRVSSLPPGDYAVMTSPPPVSVKSTMFTDIARTGRANGELAFAFGGLNTPFLEVGDAWVALGRGSVLPPPPRNGRLQIYPPTFHPSATSPAQASMVTLGSGEERASVDIQLMPAPAARVSGILADPGGVVDNAVLRLVPAGADELPGDLIALVSGTDASGGFAFAAVPPGQYTLRGRTRVAGRPSDTRWIALPIAVSGDDIDGLVATLSPPIRVRARMQFDGSSPPPAMPENARLPFSLESVAGTPETMTVGGGAMEQGAMVFGYPPGRYRVRVNNSPAGWMFKSAMLNGVDVSETPFDLTRDVDDLVLNFTDRWSGISGSVQGTGVDTATVIVFAADTQLWPTAGPSSRRFRNVRASAGGQFGISSLPPGDYYVIAVREEDAADWRDPALLDVLARTAARVTILEGEHRTMDLQVREVRR
jgi:protocatechuate 3,4-dioxygenase beta subunit